MKVDYKEITNYSDVCRILAEEYFLPETEYYCIMFNRLIQETNPAIRLANIIRALNLSEFDNFKPCYIIGSKGTYGIFYTNSIENSLFSDELAEHLIKQFSLELDVNF